MDFEEKYFVKVEPVIDLKMRSICTRPYPNHKKGCPNFNKKLGCPPKCPQLKDIIRLGDDSLVYAIFNRFDFGEHCRSMRRKHPEWTKRQVECCLYWQGTARKQLKGKIKRFLKEHSNYKIITCPEGCGVNLTETMKKADIYLEWPPIEHTFQIVLAGIPI